MTSDLKPPAYLSPSSIGTYQQCPLKFKYSRIDRLPEPPTEATLMGNFVHDVLEMMYGLPSENRTLDIARELSRQAWSGEWQEKVSQLISDPVQQRTFRWNSWWCIESLWNLEDPQVIDPKGIEFELNGLLSGVAMKGFIDRWSHTESEKILISDYKTGKTPKPHYAGDKFFQLLVYASLMRELSLGDVEAVELLYLKDGKRLRQEVTQSDLESTIEVVVKTKASIDADCERGQFAPTPTRLCDWCAFKSICPAWKK